VQDLSPAHGLEIYSYEKRFEAAKVLGFDQVSPAAENVWYG